MIKFPLHPLINKDSSYYSEPVSKKTAIEDFEKKYTTNKLLAWSEITHAKYMHPLRRGKGEIEKDKRKAKTYKNYMHMLKSIIDKNPELGEMTAQKAYEALDIKFRYR